MTENRYKEMLVMRTVMAALNSQGTTFSEKNPEIGDYKVNPNSILDDNIKLVAYEKAQKREQQVGAMEIKILL